MDQGVDKGPRKLEEVLPDEKLIDFLEDLDGRLEGLFAGNTNAMRILTLWRDNTLLTEGERNGLTETFTTAVGNRTWEDVVSYVPARTDLNSDTGEPVINPAQLRIKSQPLENPLGGEGIYLGDNWESPTIEHRVHGRESSSNTQKALDGASAQLGDIETRLTPK